MPTFIGFSCSDLQNAVRKRPFALGGRIGPPAIPYFASSDHTPHTLGIRSVHLVENLFALAHPQQTLCQAAPVGFPQPLDSLKP